MLTRQVHYQIVDLLLGIAPLFGATWSHGGVKSNLLLLGVALKQNSGLCVKEVVKEYG